MPFTQKQLEAYREFFTILGNIARRVEMEKRAKAKEEACASQKLQEK